MSYVFLPNPNLRFVQGDGVLSAEAYRALKGLQTNLQDQIDTLAEIVAQIQALNVDVTALEESKADKDLMVLGSGSVLRVGGTDLSTPVVFQLVNDQSFPAPNLSYGTDSAGVKGWMPFGSANIASLPGSTYNSLQQFVNTMHSPGIITGGGLTDLGSGNIRIAAGTGMIRVADDDVSLLPFFDFAQTDFVVPADQLTRFFGVVYNSGSPIVEMRTVFDWNKDTEIPLGSCVRFNSTTVILTNPYRTGDPITNIIQRFDAIGPAQRDNSIGGLAIGETGTRNVTVTAGRIWSRLTDHEVSAKNSSTDGMVTGYFNGSALTLTTGVTQWDNLHYNNVGTGTLDVMDNNKYANLWFFIATEGDQYGFIYGTDQYNNLAAASVEGIPSFLTENFFAQTLILGRFIFQKSAATASSIESAFTRVFTTQPVTTHNDLSGLQGGTTNQYYHLTSTQHAPIAQIGDLADPGADSLLSWNNGTNLYDYRLIGVSTAGSIPTRADADARYDAIGSATAALAAANAYTDGEISSLSTVYQPLDATLTALAGQNWAANALPIGSGADTVAQVSFAANTFPGRSSTGDLVAKAITDFAFSLLDDSSASAARETLETPSGTYAPTFTAGANVASIASAGNFMYVRVGPIVIVLGTLLVTPTTGGLSTAFSISLPVASNLGASTDLVGGLAANAAAAAPVVGYLFGSAAADNASVIFFPPTNAQQGVRCWFAYIII